MAEKMPFLPNSGNEWEKMGWSDQSLTIVKYELKGTERANVADK